MSLSDKVIKNTFYHLISQVVGFIFPLIITPYIISKIGETQFGIYAIVLGFVGTFGLFDLSLSTSFIKFISEYFNQKKIEELNKFVNTGFGLYFSFSLLFTIIGFIFSGFFISLINVPPELIETGIMALRISLVVFLIATSFTIFVSILISIQKTYLTSISGIVLGCLNIIFILFFLEIGWGLIGVMLSQLIVVFLSTIINVVFVKKSIPEIKINTKYLSYESLKKMLGFGIQMQVSKMATFASEKYDEFLLGFFSVLSNVTYFNLGGRISRLGRFLPFQVFVQIAPVAAELNAKGDEEKLNQLFSDATRYLTVITLPIFTFIFIFADIIIFGWMGERYELTVHILRILVIGQIINMIFSAPGNAIIPNIGFPKYIMREGLICLGINIILSYFLIKYFGILGAAIGSTVALSISSFYIFYSSVKFYKREYFSFFLKDYAKPVVVTVVGGIISYVCSYFLEKYYAVFQNRFSSLFSLFILGIIFLGVFIYLIFKVKYLNERDKTVLSKIISKIIPVKEKI